MKKIVLILSALLACAPVFAETRQLTDKEVDAYIRDGKFKGYDPKTVNLPVRDNSDPDELPAYKYNLFKPLSTETAIEESIFQVLGIVDLAQTVNIAKQPKCFEEVGTARMFVGSHPSKTEAIAVNIGFNVAHYLVTRALESLVDRNPDYRAVQRGWQIVSILPKAATVYNNNKIGLGPFNKTKCTR